jgi:hypothetical protein
MRKSFELSPEAIEAMENVSHQDTDPAEVLEIAELLIRDARKQFDNSHTLCGSCNLKHYQKYAEHLMHERLSGSLKKLKQCIAEIERKWS